jgi:hypothetical protein
MGIESLGDIADVSVTAREILTWDTAADWDSQTDQESVVHDGFGDYPGGGTIQKGVPKRSDMVFYAPLHDGSTPITEVINGHDGSSNNANLEDSRNVVNTTTIGFNRSNNDYITFPDSSDYRIDAPITVSLMAYFDGFDEQILFQGAKDDYENAGPRCWNGGSGDEFVFRFYTDSGRVTVRESSTGYSTGTWYVFTLTMDSSANMEAWIDKSSIGTDSAGTTALAWNDTTADTIIASRGSVGDALDGNLSHAFVTDSAWTQSDQDALVDALKGGAGGYLQTATKSFSSPRKPDLTNLSYSLNGESMDVDVIGSPGTASEETVTKTLDGSASYTLSWSNSHADFRIKPQPYSSVTSTSPTFSAGSLTG